MKNLSIRSASLIALCLSSVMLVGCATSTSPPSNVVELRNKLTRLQENLQVSSRAPVAVKEAESAVVAAEALPKNKVLANHAVWIADHKIDIASEQGQTRYLEDQRKNLSEARETARLDSRTQEADRAHADADMARRQADDLQRQIAELNAKTTERGLVVTLGDLLFETDKSELKAGAFNNLSKLSAFLTQYPDRTLAIEGHTDSVGNDDYNQSLSERRANAVKSFLVSQGISSNRINTLGKGENFPVASNDSSSGRQLNRRVEVIIANTLVSTN